MNNFIKFLLMLFLFVSVNSFAQKDSTKFQQMQELESVFKEKVKSNLGIDDAQTDKLIELQKENKKQLRDLRKEEKEIYKEIEANPEASDIDSKFNKIFELERKSLEVKENYFNELKTFLSPQQIAKTFIIKRKLYKELRKEINKRDKKNNKRNK
ncbi:MAG: hypothetical protein WAT71_15395 [Ignavibacteria bacterium]